MLTRYAFPMGVVAFLKDYKALSRLAPYFVFCVVS